MSEAVARPKIRWLGMGLWVGLILAIGPVANELQAWISGHLGARALRYLVLGFLAVTAVLAIGWLVKRRDRDPWGLAWTLAIFAGAAGWMWYLKVEAEPAHFFAYSLLSLLAFRALSCHLPDHGVYPAAAALTALVGTLDEILQWLLPNRFWDLGDVALNATAGVLVQLLIWKGLRPRSVAPGIAAPSLRIAVRLVAVATALLLLCLSNTPARVEWYSGLWSGLWPGLGDLGKNRRTRMSEFGHLYVDPEIGRFRSRLSPRELRRVDRERGDDAGRILGAYRLPARYGAFITAYRPWRDPLLFEARVHLFYRDRLWARARQQHDDPAERRRLATQAYRENLILEQYFPRTLRGSGAALKPAGRRRLEELHEPQAEFDSEVSDWLVTSFSEAQCRWGLLAVLAGLFGLDRYASRKV